MNEKHTSCTTTTILANAFTTLNNNNNNSNSNLHPASNVVNIVDLSSQGRGYGLVTKQPIYRGQVVYTERAILASQIPRQRQQKQGNVKDSNAINEDSLWPVRACQCCFRSLEPISSCQGIFAAVGGADDTCIKPINDDNNNNNNNKDDDYKDEKEEQSFPPFPNAYLWPVPGLPEASRCRKVNNTEDNNNNKKIDSAYYHQDEYGHYVCSRCKMLFCSLSCQKRYQRELGSCCCMVASMKALLDLLRVRRRRRRDHHDDKNKNNNNNTDNDTHEKYPRNSDKEKEHHHHYEGDDFDIDDDNDEGPMLEVQEPVVLAIRMFASSLHQFRKTNSPFDTGMDGLCGESSDVSQLELGWNNNKEYSNEYNESNIDGQEESDNHQCTVYTLKPLYGRLVQIWSMTTEEQEAVSLERFQQMAAMAARNGIGFQTQNPFEVYYSSLIRSTGGRNSVNHSTVMTKVSQALGCPVQKTANDDDDDEDEKEEQHSSSSSPSSNFGLQRGMDGRIRELVTPDLVALFPLTSRINHSCNPSCHIASQGFIDAHMDLVAQQDIASGEEITISYIYTGRSREAPGEKSVIERRQNGKSRHKRQRELQAKYLFLCSCPLCFTTADDTTPIDISIDR